MRTVYNLHLKVAIVARDNTRLSATFRDFPRLWSATLVATTVRRSAWSRIGLTERYDVTLIIGI